MNDAILLRNSITLFSPKACNFDAFKAAVYEMEIVYNNIGWDYCHWTLAEIRVGSDP